MREAKGIWNRSVPVNKFPPEILIHIALFFEKERDLINATAICQRWRTVLVFCPGLWRNAGGSRSEIEAYLQRSKATQLDVNLSHPSLVDLIVPHTSRLAGLTVRLDKSSSIDQFVNRLDYFIPTLHTFGISVMDRYQILEVPSDLRSPLFPSLKKLNINGLLMFHGPQVFPNVTELTWHTGVSKPCYAIPSMAGFLNTLKQLPSLERVYVTFHAGFEANVGFFTKVVTLPQVQEMSLSKMNPLDESHFPHILKFLQLPRLTTLCVEAAGQLRSKCPIFPEITFAEQLPNFTELPEMRVDTGSGEITFRNPSGATLKYRTDKLRQYGDKGMIGLEGLSLHTVQRLILDIAPSQPIPHSESAWLANLLWDLSCLEHLDIWGKCSDAVLRRCDQIMKSHSRSAGGGRS